MSSSRPEAAAALDEIERLVGAGGEADETLRQVVTALQEQAGYEWAGIFFVEAGSLSLGPEAGSPDVARRISVPVTWSGDRIADLAVDGAPEEDRPALERAAALVCELCLVAWDTGGEAWEP